MIVSVTVTSQHLDQFRGQTAIKVAAGRCTACNGVFVSLLKRVGVLGCMDMSCVLDFQECAAAGDILSCWSWS